MGKGGLPRPEEARAPALMFVEAAKGRASGAGQIKAAELVNVLPGHGLREALG